jgi:FKBP-type peptidyl-prolyl cis-trans isomerase
MILLAFAAALAAPPAAAARPAPIAAPAATATTASGLRIQTLKAGTGEQPGPGDAVLVTYVGRLAANGTVFDKSEQPVGMMVADVVPGFSEGLQLMRKGGTYRITLPPQLAYGEKGAGGGVIPPNATLEFDVTLLDVAHPPPAPAAAAPQG